MRDFLLIPFALIYIVIISLLFIYGMNFLYLTYVAYRSSKQSQLKPAALTEWPLVTVQLPVYNELYVVERLIEAAAKLEYPVEKLQIQVLDDSTDETAEIVRRAVARWQARGTNIVALQRAERTGYKAGALQNGMQTATGEFIAIFDADFVPQPEFLRQALPYFDKANIAFVQTRWDHLNRGYSLLTFLQSLAIDAHFMIEQFARANGSFLFNFNGTAGIWRKEAMVAAGGWQADTLTEDLDISYRAYLAGWEGRYIRDVTVPAELPVHFSGFRRQQHRWARGSLECAIKLTPAVWRSALPLGRKVQATLHLTGYGIHLLMLAMVILYYPVVLLADTFPAIMTLFGVAYVFNLTALAPTIYVTVAQQQIGRNWKRLLPQILLMIVLGFGLMINTGRAALQIILGRADSFERTAKFGIDRNRQVWTNKRYQLKLDPIIYWELGAALFVLYTINVAYHGRMWAIVFYGIVVILGLLFVAGMTIAQAIAIHRSMTVQQKSADEVYEERSQPVFMSSSPPVTNSTSSVDVQEPAG